MQEKSVETYRSKGGETRTQQNELNGVKQVRFSTPVTPDDTVRIRGERLNLRLLPKGSEVGNSYLLYVHFPL